jgi:hypothetical protein
MGKGDGVGMGNVGDTKISEQRFFNGWCAGKSEGAKKNMNGGKKKSEICGTKFRAVCDTVA